MELRAAPGNLVDFPRGLLVSFAALAERKRQTLRFESKAEKLLVYFDRDKAEKIFFNLLSNAIKFTPEGGSVVVAVVSVKGEERWAMSEGRGEKDDEHPSPFAHRSSSNEFIEITITDTGIGIPAEKLPHIFDRFYQVDSSHTRLHEGTGIGLALVKELVELHHGAIDVASAVGKGTTFTVRLPLGKEHLQPEEIVAISVQATRVEADAEFSDIESAETLLKETASATALSDDEPIILVVEDHAEMRRYVRNELEPVYRVLEAADGDEGWQTALETIPDLVISDVMMPKMNGYELCSRLKTDERTSHIPVILLTAKAAQLDKLAGLETGADDYLGKPFDRQELVARVKNLIALRRKLRESFRRQVVLQPREVAVTTADEAFLQRALAVMEEQVANEEFTAEDFQRAVGMSKTQLHRKLKALVNQAPREFMRSFRLQRAAQLLKQGAGNVTEIAYMVGFSSQPYFTKCFHEEFGMTPKEYAKRSAA